MKSYINYIIFFSSFLGMFFLASYAVYKAFNNFNAFGSNTKNILLWVLIIMPILIIITTVVSMKFYNPLNSIVYSVSMIWVPMLTYMFLGSVILTIFVIVLPNSQKYSDIYNMAVYFTVTASILLTGYGVINAHKFVVRNIVIPKENELSNVMQGKKIVLFADTHIGIVHKKNFLEKVANHINAQNPDIVLLAGDLVDGPKIDINSYLAPLKDINASTGVYYTPGNHEVYYGEQKPLYELTDSLVTGLRDKKLSFNGYDIIGLTYDAMEGKSAVIERLNKAGYNKNIPTILIIHEPKNNDVLQDAGVNLIVSGHTHGGQFWPYTIFVKKIFGKYYSGLNMNGNSASVTTVGIGTWGPAVRIGTKPEIISITFE